jgi:uncharacterized membrane protein YeaQ/YmgE (transglycosylase-associated protein family)
MSVYFLARLAFFLVPYSSAERRLYAASALDGDHRTRGRGRSQTHHAGQRPGRNLDHLLLGIAGALLAGWIGRAVGWYQEGQPAGFIMSVIGAIILLIIYRSVKRSST